MPVAITAYTDKTFTYVRPPALHTRSTTLSRTSACVRHQLHARSSCVRNLAATVSHLRERDHQCARLGLASRVLLRGRLRCTVLRIGVFRKQPGS